MNAKKKLLFVVFLFSILFFLGPLGKNIANGYANYLMPFILLILCQGKLKRTMRSANFTKLSFLASFFVIISYILIGGGLGSVFLNLNAILLIWLFYHLNFNQRDFAYYIKLVYCIHVYLLVWIFVFPTNDVYIGGLNPNSIALQFLFNLLYFLLCPNKSKIWQIVLIVSAFAGILICDSRTSAVTALLFVFASLYIVNKKWNKKIYALGFWGFALLGLLIPYAYAFFLSDYAGLEGLQSVSIEHFDKGIFTGRELIWSMAWDKLLQDPLRFLFGVGSHFYRNLGEDALDSNFHSSFMTLMICCGLIGYILITRLLYKLFIKDIDASQQTIDFRFLYTLLMIAGLFESVLFSGNFALQAYLFLSFSRNKKIQLNSIKIKK